MFPVVLYTFVIVSGYCFDLQARTTKLSVAGMLDASMSDVLDSVEVHIARNVSLTC